MDVGAAATRAFGQGTEHLLTVLGVFFCFMKEI